MSNLNKLYDALVATATSKPDLLTTGNAYDQRRLLYILGRLGNILRPNVQALMATEPQSLSNTQFAQQIDKELGLIWPAAAGSQSVPVPSQQQPPPRSAPQQHTPSFTGYTEATIADDFPLPSSQQLQTRQPPVSDTDPPSSSPTLPDSSAIGPDSSVQPGEPPSDIRGTTEEWQIAESLDMGGEDVDARIAQDGQSFDDDEGEEYGEY